MHAYLTGPYANRIHNLALDKGARTVKLTVSQTNQIRLRLVEWSVPVCSAENVSLGMTESPSEFGIGGRCDFTFLSELSSASLEIGEKEPGSE